MGLAKLATREDRLVVRRVTVLPHVHKCLAAVVVAHTVQRLLMGMGEPEEAPGALVAALACHVLLAASAFVFTVPARTKAPHVLDALYRAQVATFTVRSVAVMLIVLCEPPHEPLLRFAAVSACHLAADAAQRALGDPAGGSNGVRRPLRPTEAAAAADGAVVRQWMVEPGRLFFSVAQLNATSQLLYVRSRGYVLLGAFWTMAVIQFTAFLMTLRKKGLLPAAGWKVLYAAMLASVAVSMVRAVTPAELGRISAVSLAFAVARLRLGASKYVAMAAVTAAAAYERGWERSESWS